MYFPTDWGTRFSILRVEMSGGILTSVLYLQKPAPEMREIKGPLKCNLSSVPIWISVWWQERLLLLLNEKWINFLTRRCRQNQKCYLFVIGKTSLREGHLVFSENIQLECCISGNFSYQSFTPCVSDLNFSGFNTQSKILVALLSCCLKKHKAFFPPPSLYRI